MTDPSDPGEGKNSDSLKASPAERLRAATTPCRLKITWPAGPKTRSPRRMPVTDDRPVGPAGTLTDSKHEAYRTLTALRRELISFWRTWSLPFPDPPVRLITRDGLADITATVTLYGEKLASAVGDLDEHYSASKREAAQRLGPEDYWQGDPVSLADRFEFALQSAPVGPQGELARLCPSFYEHEELRVLKMYRLAANMADAQFSDELARRVGHLVGRLTGTDLFGRPKVFQDKAVHDLEGFCNRYRRLRPSSDPVLDDLVGQTENALKTVSPKYLRDTEKVRTQFATRLRQVQSLLEAVRTRLSVPSDSVEDDRH